MMIRIETEARIDRNLPRFGDQVNQVLDCVILSFTTSFDSSCCGRLTGDTWSNGPILLTLLRINTFKEFELIKNE